MSLELFWMEHGTMLNIETCMVDNKDFGKYYGSPKQKLSYNLLFPKLDKMGFRVEDYEKLGDSPSFCLDNYSVWQCRDGWRIAELVDSEKGYKHFANHVSFNQGKPKNDPRSELYVYGHYDLENALNYAILGMDITKINNAVEAIESIVSQFHDLGDVRQNYPHGSITFDKDYPVEVDCGVVLVNCKKIEWNESFKVYNWTKQSREHPDNGKYPDGEFYFKELPKNTRIYSILDCLQDLGKAYCWNGKTLYNHDSMICRKLILDSLLECGLIKRIEPLAHDFIWTKKSKYFNISA